LDSHLFIPDFTFSDGNQVCFKSRSPSIKNDQPLPGKWSREGQQTSVRLLILISILAKQLSDDFPEAMNPIPLDQ
jgi:hypothetical protein